MSQFKTSRAQHLTSKLQRYVQLFRGIKYSPAVQDTGNIFDNLPALAAPKPAELHDKLDHYLSTDPEHASDILMWWSDHSASFPWLSCMALNYLSIPGMYVLLV